MYIIKARDSKLDVLRPQSKAMRPKGKMGPRRPRQRQRERNPPSLNEGRGSRGRFPVSKRKPAGKRGRKRKPKQEPEGENDQGVELGDEEFKRRRKRETEDEFDDDDGEDGEEQDEEDDDGEEGEEEEEEDEEEGMAPMPTSPRAKKRLYQCSINCAPKTLGKMSSLKGMPQVLFQETLRRALNGPDGKKKAIFSKKQENTLKMAKKRKMKAGGKKRERTRKGKRRREQEKRPRAKPESKPPRGSKGKKRIKSSPKRDQDSD